MAQQILAETLEGSPNHVVLGSKSGHFIADGPYDRGPSRLHLINALVSRLRCLRTNHVDLCQIHVFDETAPMEKTIRVLEDTVRSGKVGYIGPSQYQAREMGD